MRFPVKMKYLKNRRLMAVIGGCLVVLVVALGVVDASSKHEIKVMTANLQSKQQALLSLTNIYTADATNTSEGSAEVSNDASTEAIVTRAAGAVESLREEVTAIKKSHVPFVSDASLKQKAVACGYAGDDIDTYMTLNDKMTVDLVSIDSDSPKISDDISTLGSDIDAGGQSQLADAVTTSQDGINASKDYLKNIQDIQSDLAALGGPDPYSYTASWLNEVISVFGSLKTAISEYQTTGSISPATQNELSSIPAADATRLSSENTAAITEGVTYFYQPYTRAVTSLKACD